MGFRMGRQDRRVATRRCALSRASIPSRREIQTLTLLPLDSAQTTVSTTAHSILPNRRTKRTSPTSKQTRPEACSRRTSNSTRLSSPCTPTGPPGIQNSTARSNARRRGSGVFESSGRMSGKRSSREYCNSPQRACSLTVASKLIRARPATGSSARPITISPASR